MLLKKLIHGLSGPLSGNLHDKGFLSKKLQIDPGMLVVLGLCQGRGYCRRASPLTFSNYLLKKLKNSQKIYVKRKDSG